MDETILITDDPGRSRGLARALSGSLPCVLHDLYADEAPACGATLLVTDLRDLGTEAVGRLIRLLARIRGDAPLVVLCHANSPRARMLGIMIGATHTLHAPFDVSRLREMAGASRPAVGHQAQDDAEPLAAATVRVAAEVRSFYARVFVPDRPITSGVIDTGTQAIALAINDTGIRDWVRAVRRFDDATHQHCLLVAGLAAAFAASLGLSARECHRLTKAALLHDVGKIHVPAAILNKPGRLDDAETAVMRGHPEKGYRMLADQDLEPEMLQVVRSHHEMLDGSGYPDGLKALEIPDLVRLVTICDLHAALIERRPYKSPMTSDAAYAVLEGMTGRLDAALVGAFRPVAAFSLRTATRR
ncbi:HD-GYP domain-containing protein [Methylobacterium platani]|uniref:Metal-dependent phosphohydrolase n=2 Tax=Methylobacterium platani TaxID=427683 RepID=A0A179S2Z2_9HYPH|nr:HD domain-containing phosphohydrolase [Methylobacterium platani]KMO11766.1 metal-dependent phosphohydrolase [Methylobacterium platani JCM 14648]OAS18815.1 metal-dependent phosphohydrolase [Methylobacterium platani]